VGSATSTVLDKSLVLLLYAVYSLYLAAHALFMSRNVVSLAATWYYTLFALYG
jgi:hypothetical protein